MSWWWVIVAVMMGAFLLASIIALGVSWGITSAWQTIKRDLQDEFGLGGSLSSPRQILVGLLRQQHRDD